MVFYKSRRGEASYRCQRGQIYEIDAPAHLQWKFRRVGERRVATHVTENKDLIECSRLCARGLGVSNAYGFVGSSSRCFIFVSYTAGGRNAGRDSVYI